MTSLDRSAEILAELNPEQRQVATSFGRPVAVLAGAGTGKTKAITARIGYGVLTGQMQPENILALTFTTKAAGELASRLRDFGIGQIQARTFHSAAYQLLRYFWPKLFNNDFPRLINSNRNLILAASKEMNLQPSDGLIRDIGTEISWAKISNILPDRYAELAAINQRPQTELDYAQMAKLLANYEQIKTAARVVDFDDLLLCAIGLLYEYSEVAAEFQDKYWHFTVDEFQDVSPAQRTLLDLWLGGNQDICVVGDSAQCIHSFAGADPSFLTNFTKDFDDALVIRLRRNYRSSPQILGFANGFLAKEDYLLPTRPAGPAVRTVQCANDLAEANQVADWLVANRQAGLAWAEQAVLYRVRAQADILQQVFSQRGLPYELADADSNSNARGQSRQAITLSTIHAAKGLEWDSVALIGFSEGLLPFVLASQPKAIAEESRLCYVALTRAKRQLMVSWAASADNGRARQLSRFAANTQAARRVISELAV